MLAGAHQWMKANFWKGKNIYWEFISHHAISCKYLFHQNLKMWQRHVLIYKSKINTYHRLETWWIRKNSSFQVTVRENMLFVTVFLSSGWKSTFSLPQFRNILLQVKALHWKLYSSINIKTLAPKYTASQHLEVPKYNLTSKWQNKVLVKLHDKSYYWI